MTLRAQIGDLERERIAEALRDIEDVLQQMGVEPKLIGFIGRIRRPVRSIASTCDLPEPGPEIPDNVTRFEGLRKAPTLRIVDGIEASRIDPAEPFLKAAIAAKEQAKPINSGDRPKQPADHGDPAA